MNKELKQRIEQINAGTAPAGYKKTKAGIVPEEWDTVKLSSISTHRTEKNKDMKFTETYTNSATQGIIRQTDYFDKQISNNENIDGYYIVCENDYVYNPRISVSAPCGPISKSHIPETGIMSPLYTVFRLNAEYENNAYIEYYFKSPFWHRYMTSIANYGARHDRMNITNADLFGMPIPFPPLPEQQKIAEILTAQDEVIALMQKQIELLQKQKKAFLQKMFPQKDCNVPEIRFAGFTDAWEKRKLGECVTITSGEAPSKFKHGSVNYVKVDDLNDAYKTVVDTQNKVSDNPSMSKVKVGSVIFPKRGAAILTNKVRILGVESYMDTNMMALTATSLDSDFLYVLISKEGLYKIADTSTIPQINNKHIEPYEVIVPTLDEQKRIGELFAHLDSLITLHQRKLEIEQQKKKALMQLLLTGKVRVKP